ncbi:hypothetical protein ASD45_04660 [Pseudolabrys sp. Root1462]|jgi:hypothetical protein|uniref:hypothetical protein n=1 Tax=Pseudolabrys sp. Root1462 TaxID=1736466 RepID=UPI000702ECF1|nr:hypothetical protein [Pseudolabrys sp. Root1462]KQZ00224.1 hypothetical protein ASD45_04660 [Pseudolabrys sp. Root1462]
MNRILTLAAALLAAGTLTLQSAQAGGRHHVDNRLKAVAIGTGAATTAGYFAINNWHWKWQDGTFPTQLGAIVGTTLACTAISPMIGTVVVNRPLTQREGHVLIGSCIVPIIGGYLVNAAYDAHPEWEPQTAPAPRHWKKKRKM